MMITTDDRIARIEVINGSVPGEEPDDDVSWLCAELRRARESLREIVEAIGDERWPIGATWTRDVAQRGLGEP